MKRMAINKYVIINLKGDISSALSGVVISDSLDYVGLPLDLLLLDR